MEQITNSEQTMKPAVAGPNGSPPEEGAAVSKAVALDPGQDFTGVWYTRDGSVATVEDFHAGQFTGMLENTLEDHLWDAQGNSLIASAYDLTERINGTAKRAEVGR